MHSSSIGSAASRAGGLALAALALFGCEAAPPPAPATPARPLVVATFYPLWEFARQVAGDRAEVVSLVPPGIEPHDWEPAPQDVARVQKARLLVYNGAGFEPFVDRLLQEVAGKGTVAVNATASIELIDDSGPAHDHKGAPAHRSTMPKGAAVNPHVWLDPVLAQAQVETIRAALARVDPANASRYGENAQAFTARLAELDEAFRTGVATCARRTVIVSHAAFPYLARRYGLREVAVSGLAPQSEPSPADLARIVRLARREKVRYVFTETLVSPKVAETLAREIGAETLVLNPLEGLTREEASAGKDYLALMRDNLGSLRKGLDCR
jgi:zinc transport system substrate-binding protein